MTSDFITKSKAALKSSEALRFSGLSGNTYEEIQLSGSFLAASEKYKYPHERKWVFAYNASSCFLSFFKLPNNSQGELNVGINKLIWRSLHVLGIWQHHVSGLTYFCQQANATYLMGLLQQKKYILWEVIFGDQFNSSKYKKSEVAKREKS